MQIIADATAAAYKGASFDIQQKIRRVVEVWRSRAIFDEPILVAVESRIDGTWFEFTMGTNPHSDVLL